MSIKTIKQRSELNCSLNLNYSAKDKETLIHLYLDLMPWELRCVMILKCLNQGGDLWFLAAIFEFIYIHNIFTGIFFLQLNYKIYSRLRHLLSKAKSSIIAVRLIYLIVFLVWVVVVLIVVVRL